MGKSIQFYPVWIKTMRTKEGAQCEVQKTGVQDSLNDTICQATFYEGFG